MINEAIRRYKSLRTEKFLSRRCGGKYAFVGMGQHSLNNLYPVLDYLKVPLKYICVTSSRKAELITKKFPGVLGTASLDAVLSDAEVRGVFVAAAPSAHFALASKILRSGKALFIEKPPCANTAELEALSGLSNGIFEAGLQKRYAPAVKILKSRLSRTVPGHYTLRYITGSYPEGNALLDLFIHPIDLVTYLFGEAEPLCSQTAADGTKLLTFRHSDGTCGTLELSTSGSWAAAQETMTVNAKDGEYRLSQMEELSFRPAQGRIFGIPAEKVLPRSERIEYLYSRNGFNPVLANNQIVSAGFFDEISAFVDAVEGCGNKIVTGFEDILPTYKTLAKI